MKEINYKKVLEKIIKENPHELDKIEKIINDAYEHDQYVNIQFSEIIKSMFWNADEKARLLTFFEYNKHEQNIHYTDEYKNPNTMTDYLYTIQYDIFSGFEALMKIRKDINENDDNSYRNIFINVIEGCGQKNRSAYLKAILDNLTDEDIQRLIQPCYEGDSISDVQDKSIFIYIIASKDIELIKKYIPFVDNINMYLSNAVSTGNIEIVKLFLEKGANINYLTDEVILGQLTPLKTAINNNDYKMVKFLIENGADIHLQVHDKNFIDRLNHYQIKIYDKWNGIKTVDKTDSEAKKLQFVRTASPLEYACVLKDNNEKKIKEREKIVDFLFENWEDKSTINYNELIAFALTTNNLEKFEKYSRLATDYNYQVDFDFLVQQHLDFTRNHNLLIPLLNLIEKYDQNNSVCLSLLNYYLNNNIKIEKESFYTNDFIKKLLNRIPNEQRKEICLVPYCKDINSLTYLMSLGFDINQKDENGKNILFHLLNGDELETDEMELFNYLLENLDLSSKDKNGKTALYYAMQTFPTKGEYQYADKNCVETKSSLEIATAMLITKMSKQDVCNEDINKILETRFQGGGTTYIDYISPEVVYQHHKDLFNALIDKGFILSDEILSIIFEYLYPKEKYLEDILFNKIDINSTLDFLYERLDHNTEIQKINIEQEFKNVMDILSRTDITFSEYMKYLNDFNGQIIQLNQFYENNIKNKFNPEKYLQYVQKKYNTIYKNLDHYLLLIIFKGIQKFGDEKLKNILDTIPNYDINSFIINSDIGLDYWNYINQVLDIIGTDEDLQPIYDDEHFEADNVRTNYAENIEFTGGLMQYAILKDDLPMVQLLQKRGANLKFLIDGEDHTWDYVNSCTMRKYMELFVGEKEYIDWSKEEKNYYSNLLKSNSDNNSEQSKKLILKK